MPKRGGGESNPKPNNEVPHLNRLMQERLGSIGIGEALRDSIVPRKTKKAVQKFESNRALSKREHGRLLGATLSQRELARLQAEREQTRQNLADDSVDFFESSQTSQDF